MMQEDFAARVRANQQQLASNVPTSFDSIVCGVAGGVRGSL
jgi:hypothetical protein